MSRFVPCRLLSFLSAFGLVAMLLFGGALPAVAVVIAVDCAANLSALQPAIDAASPGNTLSISGTCVGTFRVSKNLTLKGNAGATLDAQAGGTTLTVPSGNVRVIGLTITGGNGLGGNDAGGIHSASNLSINRSVVRGNHAAWAGGGIFNALGTLKITNSTISGNTVSGNGGATGGGLFNNGGTATIAKSTFSGNAASGDSQGAGGGITSDGALTIANSTFSNNTASGASARGGGIYSGGSSGGILKVTRSTFSGNSASGQNDVRGGGIYGGGDIASIANSTFSGNSASGNVLGSSVAGGGGVAINGGTSDITRSTFSGNAAPGAYSHGGGILGSPTISMTLRGTIVANSTSGGDCYNALVDGGYNLSSDASCGFSAANNSLPGTDPMLGPLANHGGKTRTMALAPTSPAVDAIPVGALGVDLLTPLCPSSGTRDQRRIARPQGVACDIGAYELKAPWIAAVTVDSGLSGSSPSVSGTITCNRGARFIVSITLTQGASTGTGASPTGNCNGPTPVSWTAPVNGGTFVPGSANVLYKAAVGSSTKKGKTSVVLA